MSINAISKSDPYASLQSLFSQPKQDLQSLATDLTSGNLAAAQKDFASLQQDATNAFNSRQGSTGNGPSADLQALQSALSSNNLAAAQKSFAAFQQDVQAFGMHRGRHQHSHTDADASSAATATDTTNGGNPVSAGNTANGVPNFTMAAMLAAYRAFASNGLSGATSTISAIA